MYCMSKFDIGAIFRLRYSRSKLSKTEDMAKRNSDLTRAAQKDDKKCVMDVESKSICLLAYCMLFDINWSSMRRSWARMVNGDQVQDVGRPKGSSGSSATSARSHDAYAWLKRWIEIFGDLDPVGQKFKYVVNYILPADLHEEYSRDFAFSGMARNIFPLSQRSFTRVWSLFINWERVRVRRKANTTTKCRGKDTKNYSPRVFLGHKLHSTSVWSLCAVCDELLVRSKDPSPTGKSLQESGKPVSCTTRISWSSDSYMLTIRSVPSMTSGFRLLPLMAQTQTHATALKIGGPQFGEKLWKALLFLKKSNLC
jgi:hypothetical protein